MINAIFKLLHASRIFILVYLTLRLGRNLRFLSQTRTRPRHADRRAPKVSVLIPARNEEATIVDCVTSLAVQDYPDFEIIVLNDQSTDRTGAYLDALAAQYAHVRVVHAQDAPPSQWNGKSYACHRLAQYATGDWLLFTDADTQHFVGSIAQGVAQADALGVELLSVFPKQITRTWAERLMVSFIVDFLPLLGSDLARQWQGETGQIVANGQYLLINAAAYREAGGHAAIAQALVDDFALTHHMRTRGYKTAMIDGSRLIACRMYQDAGQVWAGFSKNILLGLETSASANHVVFHFTNMFILPFMLLLFERNKRLLWLEIGWFYLLRGATNAYFARPLREALMTPFAALGVIALSLNGLRLRMTSRSILWKDRDYPI